LHLFRVWFSFNRLRQNSIDEELFDVVAGFEALSEKSGNADRGSEGSIGLGSGR
jgi:hypothetical protein